MYPILCAGGYGVPIKAGKFEVCHIVAPCSDVNSSSQLTLSDDPTIVEGSKFGNMLTSKNSTYPLIFDRKRVAACDANIEMIFREPMKIRNGLSVIASSNLVPGSIFVYVR